MTDTSDKACEKCGGTGITYGVDGDGETVMPCDCETSDKAVQEALDFLDECRREGDCSLCGSLTACCTMGEKVATLRARIEQDGAVVEAALRHLTRGPYDALACCHSVQNPPDYHPAILPDTLDKRTPAQRWRDYLSVEADAALAAREAGK